MVYSDEELEAAKQLIQDLESFNNRDLSHIANKNVTDKSRGFIITELLVREFGEAIITKRVYNPFGNSDSLCKVTNYRREEQENERLQPEN